jgi:hypothetical protein
MDEIRTMAQHPTVSAIIEMNILFLMLIICADTEYRYFPVGIITSPDCRTIGCHKIICIRSRLFVASVKKLVLVK